MIACELHLRRSEADVALECATAAMEHARHAGFAWSVGAAHRTMATALGVRDGWAPAAEHFRLAFDESLAVGDLPGAAVTVRLAAGLALRSGDPPRAEALWRSFPTHLGRSIVRSPFEEEERRLDATTPTGSDHDIPAAVRAVRQSLSEAHAPAPAAATAQVPPAAATPALPAAGAATSGGVLAAAAPDVAAGHVLHFGDCELDLARFELRRDGVRVPMEPQVFDVLTFLAERRSRVVTKEEMLDGIWGDRFVSESALTSRIKAARQATGDDGEAQRVIRTVRGRGYMFVAEVR
jgi:DNA-binding winged helix-turn-helix (wHTH) protein